MKIQTLITFFLISQAAYSEVSEIMAMKDGAIVDSSLYQKHSINQLAESMIRRMHLSHEKDSKGSIDYFNQTEIILAFSSASLISILKDNAFLNAYQVQQGASFNDDLHQRSQLENAMIGLQLGTTESANRLRPKYAFLIPKNLENYPSTKLIPNYGNILAKVKNSVKNRSTFSIGDSMDEGKETLHTFLFKNRIPVKHDFSRINYWEAQIWGDLKLGDIDSYLVNCAGFPKVSQATIKLMLENDLKVFLCELDGKKENPKQGRRITKADLTNDLFLKEEDKQRPEIKNLRLEITKNQKIRVSFNASDNFGINYCMLKVLKDQENIFDSEMAPPKIDTKQTQCVFEIDKVKLPIEIKIYVRDWYNNQTALTKFVKQIF